MAFRDDEEALRAKKEALEHELEQTKDELAQTKEELARAKNKEVEKPKPEKKPKRSRARAWLSEHPLVLGMGIPFAIVIVVAAIMLVHGEVAGVGVEARAGARIVSDDCACRTPNGRRYALEGTVASVAPDRSIPGRPNHWFVGWELVSEAGRFSVSSMGAPSGGILGDLRIPMRVGCPTDDRFVIASGGSASAYSTADGHSLWTTTVMSSLYLSDHIGSGLRVECAPLSHDATYVHVPVDEGPDANVRIDNGAIEY